MARFIFLPSSVWLLAMLACSSQARVRDLTKVLSWTKVINGKLCQPGAHPDNVAQQFFACYREEVTPGGAKFVECQEEVYGAHMDSEVNIDKVCSAPPESFRMYSGCIMMRLVASGQRPSNTLYKLNECQGGVLGIMPPPAPELSNRDSLNKTLTV